MHSSGLLIPTYDLRSAFADADPDILGAFARGTNTEGDVLTQTIDGRDLNEMWLEFQQALQAWNTSRSRLVSALTFQVNQPIEDVPQIAMDDFEEASEFGEPKGITGGGFFSLGYDFKWYDIGARFTWKFLAEANASQVESVHNQVLEADNRNVFQKTLKAIFNNVTRVANIRGNNYNVYPFYNADTTVPPPYKTGVFSTGHNHYLASGAATVDAGDLFEMETALTEHGYGAINGSQMILLANRQETTVMRNFRVATGAAYDFIPASGQAPWLLPTNVGGVVFPQGNGVPSTINGLDVIGRYGPWLIVEEAYIPAGYMVGFATGGENNANNPVGIREHQNAGLRGLRLVKGRSADYPLVDSFYNRGFGTGIRQRGAGVVMQIRATGSYAIPAAYV